MYEYNCLLLLPTAKDILRVSPTKSHHSWETIRGGHSCYTFWILPHISASVFMFSFHFSTHIWLVCKPMGQADNKKPIHQCFFFLSFFLVNFMCTLEKVQSRTQNRLLIFSYLPTPNPFNELQNVPENESPMVFICKHQFNHL